MKIYGNRFLIFLIQKRLNTQDGWCPQAQKELNNKTLKQIAQKVDGLVIMRKRQHFNCFCAAFFSVGVWLYVADKSRCWHWYERLRTYVTYEYWRFFRLQRFVSGSIFCWRKCRCVCMYVCMFVFVNIVLFIKLS